MAEVVRSGIESIPKGHWRRPASLGLPYHRIMRLIVLPQALRVMIPPTIGVYVSTIKESSLASITICRIVEPGMAIREANALRGSPMCWSPSRFGYFVICSSLSQVRPPTLSAVPRASCGHRQRRPDRHAPALAMVDGQPKTQAAP